MRGLARIAGNAMADVLGLGEEVLLLAGGVARIRPIRRRQLAAIRCRLATKQEPSSLSNAGRRLKNFGAARLLQGKPSGFSEVRQVSANLPTPASV